nr:TPA_asm: hypothetical protein HUJ06_007004 [Nelumbo nucifera]
MVTNSSSSKLPWIWCIEALASFKQVDIALLGDLISRVSDFSDESCKDARERVALRCLEQWLDSSDVSDKRNVPLVSGSGALTIFGDTARQMTCENVLHLVLNESSKSSLVKSRLEMLKQEVQEFISQKSASLPKCVLEKLKDAIVESTHPLAASLRTRSGLDKENIDAKMHTSSDVMNQAPRESSVEMGEEKAVTCSGEKDKGRIHLGGGDLNEDAKQNDNDDVAIESPKESLIEMANGKLLTCLDEKDEKRIHCDDNDFNEATKGHDTSDDAIQALKENSVEMAKEKVSTCLTEKPICFNDVNYRATKRPKLSIKASEDQSLDPRPGSLSPKIRNETLHDNALDSIIGGKGESALSREGQAPCSDKSRICVDGEDCHANTNSLKESKDGQIKSIEQNSGSLYENEHVQKDPPGKFLISAEKGILEKETQVHGMVQTVIFQDDCENASLQKQSSDNDENTHDLSPGNKIPLEACLNGSHQINVVTKDENLNHVETHSCSDANHDKVALFDLKDKIVIAMKKYRFLSFQSTSNHDSQATLDRIEQRRCNKCNRGGQLLICCATNCQLAVHECCLGSPASFDNNGNFYCPFCFYAEAIVAYHDAKKKISLARKSFAAFTGEKNEQQLKKQFENIHYEETQSRRFGEVGFPRNIPDNKHQTEIIHKQSVQAMEHQEAANDSIEYKNGYIPCEGGKAPPVHEKNDIFLTEGDDSKQVDDNHNNLVMECHLTKSYSNACSGNDLQVRDGEAFAMNEISDISLTKEKAVVIEKHQSVDWREENNKQVEADLKHKSKNSPCRRREMVPLSQRLAGVRTRRQVLQGKFSSRPNITTKETSEAEEDDISSNDSSRDQKPISPKFPSLRRTKNPWTAEEEEILLEGVKRFSSTDGKGFPWKKILEFGCHVFHKTRTPVDLKDKYRNIWTKGGPRVR